MKIPRRTLHAGGIYRPLFLTRRRFRAARDLMVAADRMRDRWSEADRSAQNDLWRELHGAADEMREAFQ
jgi:hypothetical protein